MDPTRFVQRLAAGETVQLFGLGDSLTHGYMVARGYFDQLLERLAASYPEGRVEAINNGVCGATAEDGARHLAYGGVGRATDLLFVQFGLNDAYMGVQATAFQGMVSRIIDRARASQPGLEIVLIPPPPLDDEREQRVTAPFTSALEVLADPPDLRVADVATAWRAGGSEGLFLMDGVHPSEAGYARMAEAVYRTITGTDDSPR